MRFRKLRIAWSVGWGLACVLLISLWVRSYYSCDIIIRTDQSVALGICSNYGVLYLTGSDPSEGYSSPPPNGAVTWDRYSLDPNDLMPGFHWTWSSALKSIQSPHWFVIFIMATAAAIPWLPWWSNRFSLRTLLIATTLIAVVLGLIVWLSHNYVLRCVAT